MLSISKVGDFPPSHSTRSLNSICSHSSAHDPSPPNVQTLISSSRKFLLTHFSCLLRRGLGRVYFLRCSCYKPPPGMWPREAESVSLLLLLRLPAPFPQISLCLATGTTVGYWCYTNKRARSESDLEAPQLQSKFHNQLD